MLAAANGRKRQGHQGAAPKSKDSKTLDVFSRKGYPTWELQLRISNQQTLLGRYDFNMWDSIQKFKDLLPQDARQGFSSLVDEGKSVARLQVVLDAVDSAVRSLTSAVTMRRSSWLQFSGLPQEVQQTLQDLPFEGTSHF